MRDLMKSMDTWQLASFIGAAIVGIIVLSFNFPFHVGAAAVVMGFAGWCYLLARILKEVL